MHGAVVVVELCCGTVVIDPKDDDGRKVTKEPAVDEAEWFDQKSFS